MNWEWDIFNAIGNMFNSGADWVERHPTATQYLFFGLAGGGLSLKAYHSMGKVTNAVVDYVEAKAGTADPPNDTATGTATRKPRWLRFKQAVKKLDWHGKLFRLSLLLAIVAAIVRVLIYFFGVKVVADGALAVILVSLFCYGVVSMWRWVASVTAGRPAESAT